MKNKGLLLIVMVLAVGAFSVAGCGGTSAVPQMQSVELTISAAVSLKDALTEIQTNYQAKHPNIKLAYNLGGSGSLQRQIEQGAPADIFISAAPKQMDELDAKNLVKKATRKNLVENKLVVIVPKESKMEIKQFADLATSGVQSVAVGETTTVPAGQYAQEAMKKLGIWDNVKEKLVFAKDVRTVLTYVETGNVDTGIVYKTDALSSEKVKIAVIAPEGSHQPVVYPAAILSSTKQQKAAEEFLDYLYSAESKAVFEKYGFAMGR